MINRLPLDRIRFYVAKLADEKTKSSERFACWRGIIAAANDAFENEAWQLDSLNAVQSDPAITEAFGAPIV